MSCLRAQQHQMLGFQEVIIGVLLSQYSLLVLPQYPKFWRARSRLYSEADVCIW